MVSLDEFDAKTKEHIVTLWRSMNDSDRTHFINQVALALSVWGSNEPGKRLVADVLEVMCANGTTSLADFGLYVEKLVEESSPADISEKIERAAVILEGYRIKNGLPSEPHRELKF